jgi:hypothetical protein
MIMRTLWNFGPLGDIDPNSPNYHDNEINAIVLEHYVHIDGDDLSFIFGDDIKPKEVKQLRNALNGIKDMKEELFNNLARFICTRIILDGPKSKIPGWNSTFPNASTIPLRCGVCGGVASEPLRKSFIDLLGFDIYSMFVMPICSNPNCFKKADKFSKNDPKFKMMQKTLAEVSGNPVVKSRFCHYCNESGPMMKCARCQAAHYCNAECQKLDWKEHKIKCKPLSDAQSSTASKK